VPMRFVSAGTVQDPQQLEKTQTQQEASQPHLHQPVPLHPPQPQPSSTQVTTATATATAIQPPQPLSVQASQSHKSSSSSDGGRAPLSQVARSRVSVAPAMPVQPAAASQERQAQQPAAYENRSQWMGTYWGTPDAGAGTAAEPQLPLAAGWQWYGTHWGAAADAGCVGGRGGACHVS